MRADSPAERERATTAIVHRYFARLAEVVGRHLSRRVRRRVDPEDLVQTTFRSLCARIAGGRFTLDDREDFWRLLVSIALNKTRKEVAAQMTRKRDPRRERSLDAMDRRSLAEPLESRRPTPEEAAIMAEEMDHLLGLLPADIRPIAVWKFEGYTNEEIAEKLGYTLRTVERKVRLIRERWERDTPGTPGRASLRASRLGEEARTEPRPPESRSPSPWCGTGLPGS
jgi:RNA polymerase sigma factor (sigma-70 family)